MRKLTLALLLLPVLSFAWSKDSLNRFDAQGKKDGYWKVFLDSLLYPADSINSYFWAYDIFDHGAVVFNHSDHERHWKKDSCVYDNSFPIKGQPRLLHGTFLWYNEDSLLTNMQVYENGSPTYWEARSYYKSDSLEPGFYEIFYFTKHYENTEGTFLMVNQSAGVAPTYYWFRKGKKGKWYVQKIKEPFDPDQVK